MRLTKSFVTCIQSYDPYYGFKVIRKGESAVLEQDSKSSVWTLLDLVTGQILGTVSSFEVEKYFIIRRSLSI